MPPKKKSTRKKVILHNNQSATCKCKKASTKKPSTKKPSVKKSVKKPILLKPNQSVQCLCKETKKLKTSLAVKVAKATIEAKEIKHELESQKLFWPTLGQISSAVAHSKKSHQSTAFAKEVAKYIASPEEVNETKRIEAAIKRAEAKLTKRLTPRKITTATQKATTNLPNDTSIVTLGHAIASQLFWPRLKKPTKKTTKKKTQQSKPTQAEEESKHDIEHVQEETDDERTDTDEERVETDEERTDTDEERTETDEETEEETETDDDIEGSESLLYSEAEAKAAEEVITKRKQVRKEQEKGVDQIRRHLVQDELKRFKTMLEKNVKKGTPLTKEQVFEDFQTLQCALADGRIVLEKQDLEYAAKHFVQPKDRKEFLETFVE